MVPSSFEQSEACNWGVYACSYLMGAQALVEATPTKGRGLFAPTLHLAGQGLELLLKAFLIHNGASRQVAIQYSHKINEMWMLEKTRSVRDHILENAPIELAFLRAEQQSADLPIGDAGAAVARYVRYLAILHAKKREYPTRYPTQRSYKAPRTPLLVATLYRTADDFLKRPDEFIA